MEASTKPELYDVLVVGAGPAGLSAAITAANRNRCVAVIGGQPPFGRIRNAHAVPNYPGFPAASGEQLAEAFERHLAEFGVPLIREKVSKIMPAGDTFVLFSAHNVYESQTVILATGVYRDGQIDGEEALLGQGVSYCANCDGRLFSGRRVALVSYSPDGEEEAAVLAGEFGVDITYLPQYEGEYRLSEVVHVLDGARPERLERTGTHIRVELGERDLLVDGVFIYKEAVAPHALLEGVTSDGRHLVVDRQMETGVPGAFGAGDCTGEPYQIAKAVGEGQVAALSAIRFLRRRAKAARAEPA